MKTTINHTLWTFLMLVLAANSIQAQMLNPHDRRTIPGAL